MRGLKLLTVYRLTYIYLAIPSLIFIGTWLDYGFAAIFMILFLLAFSKVWNNSSEAKEKYVFSKNILITAGVMALIWCFFAGIGYFYYQSWDYHFRNAVFRDLIFYDWPVMYDKANTPLVYYVGFWLLPAVLAKFFSFNSELAFFVGNIFLFLYAAFGTMLIFLHLAYAVKIEQWKKFLLAILILIFFSGLDIIGYLFFQTVEQPFAYHLDWWATFMQYSSLTTSMFWVYNQFITTSLAVFLIYNGKEIKNFAFIIVCLLFLAPYPTFGAGVLAVAYAGQQFFSSQNKKLYIGENILSVSNIISVFWLLPLFVLYFITNTEGADKWRYVFDYTTPLRLILFMGLEFLLYTLILFKQFRHNIFFMTAFISLLLIPFFRFDQQNNFCMRASQPALLLLALFSIQFLFISFKNGQNKILRIILILLLIMGAATPVMEFYRGIHYVTEAKKINLVKDDIYTLNQAFVRMPDFGWDANHQYTAKHYDTDIFWQYIAKKHSVF